MNTENKVTFDIWFKSLNKPAHHKAGMTAYASTTGRKTPAAWAVIFAKY